MASGTDVLIVDTAGRLQNKAGLMDELAKIKRVMNKVMVSAPHDVVLVLDATTGQNALNQIEVFREVAGVTGLVMTKLDGTARGGMLVAAAEKFKLPIHAVGVGETIDDLRPFEAKAFAQGDCRVRGSYECLRSRPMSTTTKLAIDFGPLLVFFLFNMKAIGGANELDRAIKATVAFMIATAISIVISKVKTGHISAMLWVTGVIVLVFGAMTVYFHDERISSR